MEQVKQDEMLIELAKITKDLPKFTGEYREVRLKKLEVLVNEFFKTAHVYYLSTAKPINMDYGLFRGEVAIQLDDLAGNDFNGKLASLIVKRVMAKEEEKVVDFFDNNNLDDYAQLVRLLYNEPKHYDLPEPDNADNVGEYVDDENTVSVDDGNTVSADDKISEPSLMITSMKDKQIEELTKFIVNNKLFYIDENKQVLTITDMKRFLNCADGVRLYSRNNNNTTLLLDQLAKNNFIKRTWASILATRKMFVSSTGEITTDRHYLTSSARRKSREGGMPYNTEEKKIVDFVKSLALHRKAKLW